MAKKTKTDSQIEDVQEVTKEFHKSEEFHRQWSFEVDRKYDSYRGLLEETSEAAEWTSRLHPRYIHQIIETITSSLIDPTFSFEVNPRPKNVDPATHESLISASRALERLLDWELSVDRFDTIKQRPFVLQGVIAGLTVGKNYWHQKRGSYKSLQVQTKTAVDDNGAYLGTYPSLEEVSTEGYLIDGPCFEVVDVRDFFWQNGAISPETSAFFIHRMWKTKEELEYLQSQGVYGPEAGGQSVDDLSEAPDQADTTSARERKYSLELRTKDRIPVLEYWTDRKMITVANEVLLCSKPNPFWHGEKPFVLASPLPDLFRIPGMSVVELIEDLQQMLWTLINQRLDATRLLANPAYAVRSDLDDWGQLEEIGPGSLIAVEDVNQIKPFEVNPNIPRMTLEAEGMIKADLQNISGGAPFMSGADSGPGSTDQTTATGVNIVTSLAQKQMGARRVNFGQAYEKMGYQWVSMLQQFIREDRAIRVAGKDAQDYVQILTPESIQGHFDVTLKLSSEDGMKQERMAQAQAKLQVAVQAAPIFQSVQTPLNLKQFMDDYLEAYDIDDTENYYSAQPQQAASPQGQPGQNGGPPQPGVPGQGGGVTNAGAAAGPQAPSNAASQSPVTQLQRYGASQGGAVNAPR